MSDLVRVEIAVRRYRQVAPYTDDVQTLCAVSGEASDGNPNAAIRSAIGDLLRLRPDARGCITAALENFDAES